MPLLMPEPIAADEFHDESVFSPLKRRECRKTVTIFRHGLLTDGHAAADEIGVPEECVAVGDEAIAAKVKVGLPEFVDIIMGTIGELAHEFVHEDVSVAEGIPVGFPKEAFCGM